MVEVLMLFFFFFQAEDGIRDVERSRGLGDVYKRQLLYVVSIFNTLANVKSLLFIQFLELSD
ncbi:hypothetical protein BN3456_00244 [Clostridium sp. C105KSO13]|nr:hypothetical protein BN3456_00244 [Clostridium sp. C105KSO13]